MTQDSTRLEYRRSVKCPRCGALKGEPCKYVDDKVEWRWSAKHNSYVQVWLHIKGEPFKSIQVHSERLDVIHAKEFRARREELQAQIKRENRLRQSRLAAYNRYATQEYFQLKEWLRQHGSVLWGENNE